MREYMCDSLLTFVFRKGTYDIVQCFAVQPARLQSRIEVCKVCQSFVAAEGNIFGTMAVCNSKREDMQDAASPSSRSAHVLPFDLHGR